MPTKALTEEFAPKTRKELAAAYGINPKPCIAGWKRWGCLPTAGCLPQNACVRCIRSTVTRLAPMRFLFIGFYRTWHLYV